MKSNKYLENPKIKQGSESILSKEKTSSKGGSTSQVGGESPRRLSSKLSKFTMLNSEDGFSGAGPVTGPKVVDFVVESSKSRDNLSSLNAADLVVTQ